MAKNYLHIVRVKPRGIATVLTSFPIDMLRYDGLHPSTETDSGIISESFHLGRTIGDDEEVVVELRKYAPKNWKPTRERWNSFIWEIEDHQVKSY